MMRYIIGLTGMIASGKSTVSAYLRQQGLPVVDADRISHEVILRGNAAYQEIIDAFGREYIGPDGQINRRALGETVFADKQKLQQLNSIVHPKVIAQIRRQAEAQEGVVVLDVPLLVQTGLDAMCDEVWYVTAEEELRIRRILARDGLDEVQARARVASQQVCMPKTVPVYMIDNSGDPEYLLQQVQALVKRVEEYEKTT